MKAMKRGGAVDPRAARPRSPPPLSRKDGEHPRDGTEQEMGEKMSDPPTREAEAPRSRELEETILALGAVPPSGDIDLGVWLGLGRPRRVRPRRPSARCPRKGPMGRAWPNPRPPQGKEEAAHPRVRAP